MRQRWHIKKDGAVWELSRFANVRFDVCANTVLPRVNPLRLMHQIRQDVWRSLQKLRGFAPAVRLTDLGDVWRVEAGGQAERCAPVHAARVQSVLDDPANRARWLRHAGPWRG